MKNDKEDDSREDDDWPSGRHVARTAFGIVFGIIGVVIALLVIGFILTAVFKVIPSLQGMSSISWIWDVIALLAVIWIFAWMMRMIFGDHRHRHRHWDEWGYWDQGSEYRILRRRYARGEISKKEYEQIKRDLKE